MFKQDVNDDRYAHVHDTTVDVTKLFEAKEPRAVSGVIEDERLSPSVWYLCLVRRWPLTVVA